MSKFLKHIKFIVITILFFSSNFSIGQQITTDSSNSLQDLIQNNLASGCVEISNISSSVNGSVNNLDSFGLFNRANSNFPFESGIILTTGDVNEAGNTTITSALNSGSASWGNDPDLNTALGSSETFINATSIQFDFISGTDLVEFNYILASEEYFGNNPCEYSDGFAFLIKETGTTNPFVNIALIPGTTTPVNTTTIHNEILPSGNDAGCAAVNEQYFEGFNIGDTNYNGRTTVLTASAAVTANVTYTIKLIIADARDQFFDSAVFIQANSFDNTVDLGPDIFTCNDAASLDGTVLNSNASYTWTLNGTALPSLNDMPIVSVNQSGTYEITVSIPLNGSTCTFSDSVVVNLNNIETGPILSDLALCDDPTNDGLEVFDFSSAETQMTSNLPQPETYTISYHSTNADAISGNSPIPNPNNYTNNTSPELIFIRAVNSQGCIYVSTFNLIVNEFPIITDPTDPFTICANDGGAFLPVLDDAITGMNPNFLVTYHNTPGDAQSGNNPLTFPYTPASTPEIVYIRVTTSAGCFDTGDVELIENDNPVINTEVQQIDACMFEADFAAFDITSVEADILGGLTGVTVTYHENLPDANTGNNPIPDPTNYTNIIPEEQLVYIRVVDDASGCATIHPIELHTFLLYTGTDFIITPASPVEYGECDNDFDGMVEFDLTTIAGFILNDVDDTTVLFYENDPVTNPSEPEIDQTVPYIINGDTTIFVRLDRVGPTCSYNNNITLIIFDGVAVNPLTAQDYCDNDDDLSEVPVNFTDFEPYLDSEVTSSGTFNYTFFPTLQDAEDDTNQYGTSQVIFPVSNPQSFFVTVTNQLTGCIAIEELLINFLPAPSLNPANIIYRCNADGTSDAVIDLETVIPEINNGAGLNFTFYTNNLDAESATNAITTPTAYNTSSTTLFARVENASTGCFDVQSFEIIVNPKPVVPTIEDYVVCLNPGDTQGEFFFEMEKDAEILGAQTGIQVFYFSSQSGADNYDPANGMTADLIDKTIAYQTSNAVETIFVRVENINDPSCATVGDFEINIGQIPIYNTAFGNFGTCDDASNDGIATFDLSNFSTVLQQGSSQNLTITYYFTEQDAIDTVNPIPDITNFTNTQNPQTLYFNIDNGTICDGVDNFEILVNPIPSGVTPAPLTVCDTNTDGIAQFDLTAVEDEVLSDLGVRQDDIEVNYFPSQTDFDNNTNQIPTANVTNYTNISNPQTVIIQILNTSTTCFDTVELVLNVEVPPTLETNLNFETCDNTASTFDFNDITEALINTQTNVVLEFYASQNDATTQNNPLSNPFTYSATNTTLFVRANFSGSDCFNITSFNLQVNPRPSVGIVNNLVTCDTDYDFMEPFDLSIQTPAILGAQNPANFSVNYFNSQQDADDNTNAITDLNVVSEHNQVYFIRIENNTTGCYNTTTFSTIVNRKPVVELDDKPLCLDNLPLVINADTGFSTDTYLWSTNETTAQIEINSIGSYTLTVTTAQGCSTTDSFDVIESEAATIEFTQTVDFADPNSITIEVSGIGDYLYQLDGGLPQTSNVFNDVSHGAHIITVIDQLGCNSVTKEVIVIDAPLFFTPNGDGYNDTWHITGVEQLNGTIVYIFDRYGKLLKTLLHNSPGWNGFYNGYLMPGSDYWFLALVKKDGIEFEVKGHFALKH
ncbi:T9SS type B sorting domain-containing protein [Aurantibacter aestuarii]|uniref:PKD domain-containing protein n=1 Tax=Aurantibacter aestuarii TaxID=1266046 RepID=A0A2T1N9Y3_9FLAO|nr:choice-of-anchor L domain-containing protein [Aurantibacter aestuarii]PSG88669.1 hypothetical protein C7H52_10275 [Aurantibacter aestuarii]